LKEKKNWTNLGLRIIVNRSTTGKTVKDINWRKKAFITLTICYPMVKSISQSVVMRKENNSI